MKLCTSRAFNFKLKLHQRRSERFPDDESTALQQAGPVDARYKKGVYNTALEIHGLGAFRYQSHMNALAGLARPD